MSSGADYLDIIDDHAPDPKVTHSPYSLSFIFAFFLFIILLASLFPFPPLFSSYVIGEAPETTLSLYPNYLLRLLERSAHRQLFQSLRC